MSQEEAYQHVPSIIDLDDMFATYQRRCDVSVNDGIQKVIAHFKDEGKSIIGVINDSLRDLLSQDVKDAMEDFVDVAPDLVKQALVRKTKLVCCHQPRLY